MRMDTVYRGFIAQTCQNTEEIWPALVTAEAHQIKQDIQKRRPWSPIYNFKTG